MPEARGPDPDKKREQRFARVSVYAVRDARLRALDRDVLADMGGYIFGDRVRIAAEVSARNLGVSAQAVRTARRRLTDCGYVFKAGKDVRSDGSYQTVYAVYLGAAAPNGWRPRERQRAQIGGKGKRRPDIADETPAVSLADETPAVSLADETPAVSPVPPPDETPAADRRNSGGGPTKLHGVSSTSDIPEYSDTGSRPGSGAASSPGSAGPAGEASAPRSNRRWGDLSPEEREEHDRMMAANGFSEAAKAARRRSFA